MNFFEKITSDCKKHKYLWFDKDHTIVKIVEIVNDSDKSMLIDRGVKESGIFISHNPFRSELDYYVGSSYFAELGVRTLSKSQAESFESIIEKAKAKIDIKRVSSIDYLKMKISDSDPMSKEYIEAAEFEFMNGESLLIRAS